DVGTGPDVGIADIGQVWHLRALGQRGRLDLHVCTGLGLRAELRARTQVRVRADRGVRADLRIGRVRTHDGGPLAHPTIGQRRVGADLGAGANRRSPV